MNGFVNTLLSVMLSWIRALIRNIWIMLSSEDGGALYQFLSSSWLTIVIVLCLACLLVDAVVYFFRWRPDYVWASKWRRLRRKRPHGRKKAPAGPERTQEAFYAYPEPAQEDAFPTESYAPLQSPTAVYAPVSQPTRTWQMSGDAQQELQDPVFDDAALWESDELAQWQPAEQPAFGSPRPEPLEYFRDVQAGFAPAIPPEKLYTPSAGYQPQPAAGAAPVHPGLDDESVRQSMGLDGIDDPVMRGPIFRPFTVTHAAETPAQQNAFQRFAQRAREFIAADEAKTIHDLQSSVDVSKAFHEPVYPQSYDPNKE